MIRFYFRTSVFVGYKHITIRQYESALFIQKAVKIVQRVVSKHIHSLFKALLSDIPWASPRMPS